jgi:Mlc titration factor MtfA (ptsG expression regulator)
MFGFFKRRRQRRREAIRARPFPAGWREALVRKFPLFSRLTEADRHELEGHILVFLEEKTFEGCGGFEMTDEARVLIAAQACLLLLHRHTECYPKLRTILVYPDTYVAKTRWNEKDEDSDRDSRARLGESWDRGVVVLAWSSAVAGAANIHDGQNVVFHEFAHQLDQEDGAADGLPPLECEGAKACYFRYGAWARVLGAEFEALRRRSEKGRKTVLDQYGATNAAEFFAVATECFFEKPQQMKKKHPELYEELKEFYRQDPVNYTPASAAPSNAG